MVDDDSQRLPRDRSGDLEIADPAAFIERLRERVRRDYEQNREQMGWTERTRDIAERSLNVVLETLKLPNV